MRQEDGKVGNRLVAMFCTLIIGGVGEGKAKGGTFSVQLALDRVEGGESCRETFSFCTMGTWWGEGGGSKRTEDSLCTIGTWQG